MRKKAKKRGERFSITISSQNDALRAPTSIVVKKSTIVLVAVLLVCVFGMSAYLSAIVIFGGGRSRYADTQTKPGIELQTDTLETSTAKSG